MSPTGCMPVFNDKAGLTPALAAEIIDISRWNARTSGGQWRGRLYSRPRSSTPLRDELVCSRELGTIADWESGLQG